MIPTSPKRKTFEGFYWYLVPTEKNPPNPTKPKVGGTISIAPAIVHELSPYSPINLLAN